MQADDLTMITEDALTVFRCNGTELSLQDCPIINSTVTAAEDDMNAGATNTTASTGTFCASDSNSTATKSVLACGTFDPGL